MRDWEDGDEEAQNLPTKLSDIKSLTSTLVAESEFTLKSIRDNVNEVCSRVNEEIKTNDYRNAIKTASTQVAEVLRAGLKIKEWAGVIYAYAEFVDNLLRLDGQYQKSIKVGYPKPAYVHNGSINGVDWRKSPDLLSRIKERRGELVSQGRSRSKAYGIISNELKLSGIDIKPTTIKSIFYRGK